MTARIIDGKTIAAELRGRVADAAHRLARDRALVPGLAVVLVGNNPASEIYVGSKTKATVGSGMRSFEIAKFCRERCVWAPQSLSAGTSIGPKVSFSMRTFLLIVIPPEGFSARALNTRRPPFCARRARQVGQELLLQ